MSRTHKVDVGRLPLPGGFDWGDEPPLKRRTNAWQPRNGSKSPPPGQREGTFADADLATVARMVRGVLVERTDRVLKDVAPVICAVYGVKETVLVDVIYAVQVALFPEEFDQDEKEATAIQQLYTARRVGVIPSDGLVERVGENLRVFAQTLSPPGS